MLKFLEKVKMARGEDEEGGMLVFYSMFSVAFWNIERKEYFDIPDDFVCCTFAVHNIDVSWIHGVYIQRL